MVRTMGGERSGVRSSELALTARPLSIDGVLDIECADWDRFLCGEVLDADGTSFQSWDEDALAATILERSGVYYAHAGGRYDALWLLDWAVRHGWAWEAKLRGAGVLSVTFGSGKERLEVRDSHALVPMSLKKAAPIGGTHKVGLGLPCECAEGCDGYCALSRPLRPRERRIVGEYLHQDCVALLAMLRGLAGRAESEEIPLGLTVGGTAWATARTWLDLPAATHDLARYTLLRQGYYGGRCEVFRPRARAGERYDIHSSYPAALQRTALPMGEPIVHAGSRAARYFDAGHEGVIYATVKIPESFAPPLPVRMPDRLLFAHGEAHGAWTALELRHAVENGVKIKRIASALFYAKSERALAPFAERVWAMRDDAASEVCSACKLARREKRAMEHPACEREDAFAAWYKWLANSCTGKLAQRPEHETLRFVPRSWGCEDNAPVIRTTEHGFYIAEPSVRIDACAHVEWAAYLTSEARCELHRQLLHAGRAAIYCDTDSVYATRALTRRIGGALGEWGHEGSLTRWRALAPKVYSYEDEDGEAHVRGKGMSGLDAEGFDSLSRGGTWHVARGVRGLRTSIRSADASRLFVRKTLARTLAPVLGWVGGRKRDGATTRAVTIAEYEGREV